MFNKNLFRAAIVSAGETLQDAAAVIGCDYSTLSRKMSGETDFKRDEIDAFKRHYSVDQRTLCNIFFAE